MYIEITIDPNYFYNVVTGRMNWKRFWITFTRATYQKMREHNKNYTLKDIYDKTYSLRTSSVADLKKYYRKTHKLYILTISVRIK